MNPHSRRYLLVGAFVGLFVGLLVHLDPFALVAKIDRPLSDYRTVYFADTTPFTSRIVIVDIDEESIAALEPQFGRFPWPRRVHAWLVNYLAEAGAKAVGFDVIFAENTRRAEISENELERLKAQAAAQDGGAGIRGALEGLTPGASDDAPASAAAYSGNTYFATIFTMDEKQKNEAPWLTADETRLVEIEENIGRYGVPAETLTYRPPAPEYWNVTPPLGILSENGAGIGHINFFPDPDGPCRSLYPYALFHGKYYPSMAVSIAAHDLGGPVDRYLQKNILPLSEKGELLIRYQGGRTVSETLVLPNGRAEAIEKYAPYYRYIPYRFVLHAIQLQAQGRDSEIPKGMGMDPEFFKDKIVLVASTAAGLLDLRATPFQSITPGVEIHANVIDNLLAQRFLRAVPKRWILVSLLVISLLTGLTAARFSWVTGLVWIGALITGAVSVSWRLYPLGWSVPLAPPVVAAVGTYLFVLLYKYATEEKEKGRVRKAFGHYLAASVLEEVLKNPESLKLGGEKRFMTVLFSDVAGFTTMAEKLPPEEVAHVLNGYLTRMTDVVFENGGIVDKFIGDAVVAEWNAPGHQADHAARGCRTALRMLEELAVLQKKWEEEGKDRLEIRIGLNTGDMVVGNMGSNQLFDYTVIGNEVNTGARLEPLNKDFGTVSMVSGVTHREAEQHAPGEFVFRVMPPVAVKGRKTGLEVSELVGFSAKVSDVKKKAVVLFEAGIKKLRAGDRDGAAATLREALALVPDDGPSETWLELMEDLPPDWDGIYIQKTK